MVLSELEILPSKITRYLIIIQVTVTVELGTPVFELIQFLKISEFLTLQELIAAFWCYFHPLLHTPLTHITITAIKWFFQIRIAIACQQVIMSSKPTANTAVWCQLGLALPLHENFLPKLKDWCFVFLSFLINVRLCSRVSGAYGTWKGKLEIEKLLFYPAVNDDVISKHKVT